MTPKPAPGSPAIRILSFKSTARALGLEILRIRDRQWARQNACAPFCIGGLNNSPDKAELFVAALIALVRGKGGFRAGSSNFVGEEAILDAREAFTSEGYVLSSEGELYPSTLDDLAGINMTTALEAY